MNKVIKFSLPAFILNLILVTMTIERQAHIGIYGGGLPIMPGPRHDWMYWIATAVSVAVFHFLYLPKWDLVKIWKSYGTVFIAGIILWFAIKSIPDEISFVHLLHVTMIGFLMPATLLLLEKPNLKKWRSVFKAIIMGPLAVVLANATLSEQGYAIGGSLGILLTSLAAFFIANKKIKPVRLEPK